VSKTDANVLQVLDRVTLEPLAIQQYKTILKELDGPLSAAHGGIEDGEFYNYVLSLGPTPGGSASLVTS
jgi:torulene dioxygenase